MITQLEIKAAEYAKQAYDDNCSAGVFFTDGPYQAWVYEEDDRLFVAFRGTDSMRDMLTNLKTHPIRNKGAWMHLGFYNATVALMEKIIPLIDTAHSKNKMVIATGHSQGGALAVLAGFIYPATINKVVGIAVPPCIRTKKYRTPIIVINDGRDPVARVRFLGVFKHCYKTIWINKKRGDIYGLFTGFARLMLSQFSNFRYHRIDSYINQMKKLTQR